jgi:acetylornithine deacetylase/succinyl-diaminopimelate desuccinylase-like protein
MDFATLKTYIDRRWDVDVIPRLVEYVKVPAKSPAFDADWRARGQLQSVIQDAHDWAAAQGIAGMQLEIVTIEGRTPCLFFDVPATGAYRNVKTVLFYGHLDKQPEMVGWHPGRTAWTPVLEDGKLYGRGGGDDGYAVYSALTAIAAIDAQAAARPRCVGIIETCEESGSPDLPAYLELLAPRLGDVALVVALDSGCGNYEQLWITSSLRGLVGGTLRVEITSEGVHSGKASGLVPSSFRIARLLLDRVDDPATGRVLGDEYHATVPDERMTQIRRVGEILGDEVWKEFPWAGDATNHSEPTTRDPIEGILARTWRPALSITGASGLPDPEMAGNVLRPQTSLKLSMRIPPTVDAARAARTLKATLEADPPYNARVTFNAERSATGWNAPATAPWLVRALDEASMAAYGKEAAWLGEGGSIPFMNMLGARFPRAQFVITGVMGPQSNAHGPNEFLHIAFAKGLTASVAHVVGAMPA